MTEDHYSKPLDTSTTENLLFGVRESLPSGGADSSNRLTQLECDRQEEHINAMRSERELKEKQLTLDRELKEKYANWFFWLLVAQLCIMNSVFIGVGVGGLKFDKWTLELYLSGTLLEVFGVVYFITKNLFPQQDQKIQKSQ